MITDAARRQDRAIGSFLGLAIGDAVGTTVEFARRGSFPPLTDMIGGGPFNLAPGQWTDDTSMALCLGQSLVATQGRLDPKDLLSHFLAWYRHGLNSVTGVCFGVGNATSLALETFERAGTLRNNTAERMQGNGSIMRLAPAVICARSEGEAVELARAQGQTSHAASVPDTCCALLASELWHVLETGRLPGTVQKLARRTRDSIDCSGHAPATHDAARWAVASTQDFRSAILAAANLGDDADTVAAVAGQIAGALYGRAGIPADWLKKLAWRTEIEDLAEQLWALRSL